MVVLRQENVDADKYPGLFYTGERWRVRVYNPDLIMGTDFIVPATGWYCVLCQKFYYSEGPAKSTHCQTEDHWENLRVSSLHIGCLPNQHAG